MTQRLPAVPTRAPGHPHPCHPSSDPRGRSRVPQALRARFTWGGLPWLGSHSPASGVHQRPPPAGPSARAALSIDHCRRRRCPADAPVARTLSSGPLRPQRRLRPPEPRLAPSLTDIRAPGAAGRAAPHSSPGTSAAHRPGALSGRRRPQGSLPSPASGSPLSVHPHFECEVHDPRLRSRCPSSPGPPHGRCGGTARLLLRAALWAGAATSAAVCKPALPGLGCWGCDLGILVVPGCAGSGSSRTPPPRCFWPPLRDLPSETLGIRKLHFVNFAFSFEFSAQ